MGALVGTLGNINDLTPSDTPQEPFKGPLKVYIVDEGDDDREKVLHFKVVDVKVDVEQDYTDIYDWDTVLTLKTQVKRGISSN